MVSDKCLIYTVLVTMFIYNDTFGIAHPKMACIIIYHPCVVLNPWRAWKQKLFLRMTTSVTIHFVIWKDSMKKNGECNEIWAENMVKTVGK